jgi:hypothetical protein
MFLIVKCAMNEHLSIIKYFKKYFLRTNFITGKSM